MLLEAACPGAVGCWLGVLRPGWLLPRWWCCREQMGSDPLQAGSQANTLVTDIRKRKVGGVALRGGCCCCCVDCRGLWVQ